MEIWLPQLLARRPITDIADAALADVALADAAPTLASGISSRVGRVRTKRKGAFDPSEEAKKPQHEK